ncbi:uncharacterized protein LOC134751601 [Cydia strobilella]|uniref:uncharacterized protein LOC134751601 n=1 Tax=Cydia strobilella TaxID=1100964 RepID=UPI003004CE5D
MSLKLKHRLHVRMQAAARASLTSLPWAADRHARYARTQTPLLTSVCYGEVSATATEQKSSDRPVIRHFSIRRSVEIVGISNNRARRCRVGAASMAPAEHARLGADARLAARVCGARLRARTDVGDRRAPVSRQRRPYQRTDTRQGWYTSH